MRETNKLSVKKLKWKKTGYSLIFVAFPQTHFNHSMDLLYTKEIRTPHTKSPAYDFKLTFLFKVE